MTAIMAATADTNDFDNIMKALIEIARMPLSQSEEEDTSIAQVHATNCLREAFKTSLLSTRCEPFIGDCLQLAVDSLKSDM